MKLHITDYNFLISYLLQTYLFLKSQSQNILRISCGLTSNLWVLTFPAFGFRVIGQFMNSLCAPGEICIWKFHICCAWQQRKRFRFAWRGDMKPNLTPVVSDKSVKVGQRKDRSLWLKRKQWGQLASAVMASFLSLGTLSDYCVHGF